MTFALEKEINDNYVTQAIAAQMLNITRSRVNILCRQGRFKGAFKAGFAWLIPKIAVVDFERKKRGRKTNSDRVFLERAINESKKWRELAK